MSYKKGLTTVAGCAVTLLLISFQSVTIAVTTADTLNVREAPNGDIVDQLPLATRVGVIGAKGTWAKVMYLTDNREEVDQGWVSVQYLRIAGKGASGYSSSCQDEYRSGAEVCLQVTSTDLNCDESYTGDYYDSCEVNINYNLDTDYEGQSSIEAEVGCDVEISYEARNGYGSSDSDGDSYSHDLYEHDSESGSMTFDFSFSSYDEVYDVEISSTDCRLEDLELE